MDRLQRDINVATITDRIRELAARGDFDHLQLISDVIDVLLTLPRVRHRSELESAILSYVAIEHPALVDRMARHLPAFVVGYFNRSVAL